MSDLIDREWLLHATSILDLLSVGWQPGRAELGTARQVDNWVVTAASAGRPYQLAGTIHAPVPVVLTMSLFAIDPQAGWARLWDEWIVLDRHDAGAPTFDPADVQRVGAAWLIRQLIGPSADTRSRFLDDGRQCLKQT